MKKITTIEELMEILESNEYCYYGLRGATDHDLEIMDRGYLDCSQDNWNERDCDWHDDAEMLNGTSCIGIDTVFGPERDDIEKAYETASGYAHNHHDTDIVLLIADGACESGADDGEWVLGSNGYGADVIAIVKL